MPSFFFIYKTKKLSLPVNFDLRGHFESNLEGQRSLSQNDLYKMWRLSVPSFKRLPLLLLMLLELIKEMTISLIEMTLKGLEGQRSVNQNDLDNMKVKCTKFDVSTFISFEVIDK